VSEQETKSKRQRIQDYVKAHPEATTKEVVAALKKDGVSVRESSVWSARSGKKAPAKKATKKKTTKTGSVPKTSARAKYPRHSLDKALRIPKAILEQNAGKDCTDKNAAGYLGLKSAKGPFAVEISSALKYGLLERPKAGRLALTDLAKRILRPQEPSDEVDALREAVLKAPDVSVVYGHYRGENLPDDKFFNNALIDTFKIPKDKIAEFKDVFFETLNKAQLLQERDGKQRVVDFAKGVEATAASDERLKRIGKDVVVDANDTCFVMMPFTDPHGGYYSSIYEPAIRKAGLKPVRADNEIFGTGKIMNQVWSGIKTAKVLVAELTTKNPNVFYELGLAHALKKPVVLVSSNEKDVPFDLQHIRVIYYDVNDPFWGNKLLEKVAENILSALKNPEEAIFEGKIGD